MPRDIRWDLEIIEFLFHNLSRRRAHDQMNLMRAAIDLHKQPL